MRDAGAVGRKPSFVSRHGGFFHQATVDIGSIDLANGMKNALLPAELRLELEEPITMTDAAAEIEQPHAHLAQPKHTGVQQPGLQATPCVGAGAKVILRLIAAPQEQHARFDSLACARAEHEALGIANPTSQCLLRVAVVVAGVHPDHGLRGRAGRRPLR